MLLPNNMAVRNTLETPVLEELAAREDLEVCFLTPSPDHAAKITSACGERFTWSDMGNPTGKSLPLSHGSAGVVWRRLAERALMKPFRQWAGWGNLVFRFNERAGFTGHRFKKKLPPERRERENLAGNYPDPRFGRPFPSSRFIYNLIYRLYHTTWYSEPAVEAFFDDYEPDLLVIHNVQNQAIRPWISAARRRSMPMLGIVGSWDQPTSKGPMPPGLGCIILQSQIMKEQLITHHEVPAEKSEVTGWPQMDIYKRQGSIGSKADLYQELGLDPERRIILFGGNSARLGGHEPSIARHLANQACEEAWGSNVSLVIRPHPNDHSWAERFTALHKPPMVTVLPNESGRLLFLADLLDHASVVLASVGTILLDAVGMDTCVVNIAFDGDLSLGYYDSIRRWAELDHFRPVLASGGVASANSFEQMDEAIRSYLTDPELHAEGRARCRKEQLKPFDGKAACRLADIIVREAGR